MLVAYQEGRAPINSVEGYVRQVLGWREFINGAYWHARADLSGRLNFLDAQRPLPAWFYTGETEMNCLRQCITQALELGWIHHIQRLMIVGNFLLDRRHRPAQAALDWYLEMTVDAYDWVMVPNVLGIILHADGGYVGTKPYAAGSGYIHKMSNYCEGCRYSPLTRKLDRTRVRSTRCTGISTDGTRTCCATTRASAAWWRRGNAGANPTVNGCNGRRSGFWTASNVFWLSGGSW